MIEGRSGAMIPLMAAAAFLTATAAASLAGAPPVQPAGDPEAGKAVSGKCMACHSFVTGQNKVGPSLAGVVGRRAGTAPNFAYSAAMKGSNLTWDPATLDRYLTSPRAVVPGTRMFFPGIPAPADRANLIAYLATPKP